eukprot:INCI14227.1.p1 GENE.INCI14227.1~~INCI14227.1.p1  ORF type:complete len:558 (+),score=70.68 INCI14227.1:319-1992(+)
MRFFAFAAAAAAASLLGAEVSAFDESLCAPACAGTTSNVGNGKCNLVNNNCGCSWDGGDCCGTSGNANQYSACGVDKTAGSEAECCIDPNYAPLTGPPRTSPSTTGRPTIASTTRPQSSSTTRPRSTTQTRPDLGAPAPGRPDAVPSPAPGRPDAVPAPRGGTLPPRTTAEVTRPRISSTSTTSPPRGGGGGVTRQSTTRGGAPRRTTLVETRPPVESTTSTLPPRGGNGDPTRGQTSEPTRPDFTTTARKSNTITGASTRRSTTTTSTAANAPTTTTKTTTAGGPFDEANCKPQCTGNIANLGNRKCNNVNNNCACDWDHGDCCGSTGLSTQYSSCGGTEEACCLDPKFGAPVTTTIHSVPTTTTTKAPPTTTKAAQVTTTTANFQCEALPCNGNSGNIGNGKCNNVNNNCRCSWDGGDCCGTEKNPTQFSNCGGSSSACCLDPSQLSGSSGSGGVETTTAPVVGGTDIHGCPTGSGYTWCMELGACIRTWETPCESSQTTTTSTSVAPGGDFSSMLDSMDTATIAGIGAGVAALIIIVVVVAVVVAKKTTWSGSQ